MADHRIVLLGATGFTGGAVLGELLASGLRPLLIGRSAARLASVAAAAGAALDVLEIDITEVDAMSAALEPGDVIISTVGPFMTAGRATAVAAAQRGCVYFDSTGEPPFVRWLFESLHHHAARNGATLVPAFGYDYVPGNLAGALALHDAGANATRVEVGYFFTRDGDGTLTYRSTLSDVLTLTSGGTRASMVTAMTEDMFALRPPGRIVTEPIGQRLLSFDSLGVSRTALSVGGSEHFGLPQAFPQLTSVDVGLGWFGHATPAVRAAMIASRPVLSSRRARSAMSRLAARLPLADRRPDADGRSLILATARAGDGSQIASALLTGPDPYVMTGRLLAWAAGAAAAGTEPLPTGVQGPLGAFGLDWLGQGAAAAGITVHTA